MTEMMELLDSLKVRYPAVLSVECEEGALVESMSLHAAADFLDHLTGGAADVDVRPVLAEVGLVAEDGLCASRAGNGLLRDGDQRPLPVALVEALNRDGFETARRGLDGLAQQELGAQAVGRRAALIVQGLLAALERRQFRMLERRRALAEAGQSVAELLERNSARQGDAAASEAAALELAESARDSAGGWRRLTGQGGGATGFEREYLLAALRRRGIEAERDLLQAVGGLLGQEAAADEEARGLAARASARLRSEAARAEGARAWGVASGEVGVVPGAAAVGYAWGGDAARLLAERYEREFGADFLAATSGALDDGDVDDLLSLARDMAREAVGDWTVEDLVAALEGHDRGRLRELEEALRSQASRGYLAPGYEGVLDHVVFARVARAASPRPRAREAFARLVSRLERSLDYPVKTVDDPARPLALLFFVQSFRVPAASLKSVGSAAPAFAEQGVAAPPRFCPHPELAAAAEPAAAPGHSFGDSLDAVSRAVGLSAAVTPRVEVVSAAAAASGFAVAARDGGLDTDTLGDYDPRTVTVRIFADRISAAAGDLSLRPDLVRRVVEIHEAAHFLVHLGDAGDGGGRLTAEEYRQADGGDSPSRTHELFAQLFTHFAVRHSPELAAAFRALCARQSPAYRLWEAAADATDEAARAALAAVRDKRLAATCEDVLGALGAGTPAGAASQAEEYAVRG